MVESGDLSFNPGLIASSCVTLSNEPAPPLHSEVNNANLEKLFGGTGSTSVTIDRHMV